MPIPLTPLTLEKIGTCDIDSTPPAITMSCVPLITACAAKWIACWEEPHCRSTAVPGTLMGSTEESTTLRATLQDCSPTCETHPKMTSSTSDGSKSGVRSPTNEFTTAAPRSAGCSVESVPLFLPAAVRAAATMKARGEGILVC